MTPFQIGFLFGGLYEAIKLLRLQHGHHQAPIRYILWHLFLGLPGFFAFSFAAGALIEWGPDSTKNHTLDFLAILVLWACTLVGETWIERSFRCSEENWWTNSPKALAASAGVVFVLFLLVGISPYFLYQHVTGWTFQNAVLNWTVGIIVMIAIVVLSVAKFYFFIQFEERAARKTVGSILSSFMARQSLRLYDVSIVEQMLEVVDREQIMAYRKITFRHRREMGYFAPEQNGHLHPGLEMIRLPRPRLLEVVRVARQTHQDHCDLAVWVADFLVGESAKSDEARDWLRENMKTQGREAETSLQKLDVHRSKLHKPADTHE